MISQYLTRHHLTISKDHILKTLTRNFNSKLKHGLFFIQQVLLVILVFFEANITTWGEIMIYKDKELYILLIVLTLTYNIDSMFLHSPYFQ